MLGGETFAFALIAKRLFCGFSNSTSFRAMIVDISAWSAIGINRVNQRPASTGAWNLFFWLGSLAMKRHMTLSAEGGAVRNFVAQVGVIGIGLDVMRRKTTLALLALAATFLADVAITFQHRFAPGEVFGIFEALSGTAAFPVVVALTPPDAAFEPCLKEFRTLLVSPGSATTRSGNFSASLL